MFRALPVPFAFVLTVRALFATIFVLELLNSQVNAVDNLPPGIKLHLAIDATRVPVGDPLLARISFRNDGRETVIANGGIPSFSSGDLNFQWRKVGGETWTPLSLSHIDIEPGMRNDYARLEMRPGQEYVSYECLAYRTEWTAEPRAQRRLELICNETGEFEFRARGRIGDYDLLYSTSVRVTVDSRPEIGMAALDLGEELLQKAGPLHRSTLSEADNRQSEKLQKYLGDSRAAWLLKWKSAWATWLADENLVRPRVARDLLVSMRDAEKGLIREVLTLSLARGYLSKGQVKFARMEAESLPEGSLDRRLLLLEVAEREKATAREKTP